MNIPFRFALNTSTKPIGRLFEYAAGGTDVLAYDLNNTLASIAGAAGFGASAATRLAKAGIVLPANPFWVLGYTLTAWYSTDSEPKVDFGVWDHTNGVFIPLYECVATASAGGGIAKPEGRHETGIYVPYAPTLLLPAFRVSNQNGTDGAVTVAGDVSFIQQVA